MDGKELVTSIKINKILLNETKDEKLNETMSSKTDIKNCLVTHCTSSIFKLLRSSKTSMCLIERCFPVISDSDNFLELDFISIKKLLSSSGLNIDSELQVFNAADSWLSHDITDCRKNAKDLLSKVRFSLLSIPALQQILERVSSIYHKCSNIIEAVLVNKQQLNKTDCNITSRYCKQTNFNILVCGGKDVNMNKVTNDVISFDTSNLCEVNHLLPMKKARSFFETVCIKGEIYVFGGIDYDDIIVRSVEKYSPVTNSWKFVINMMDNREMFSGCSLMDNVYIIGGLIRNNWDTATCFEFNTKSLKWKEISKMNDARRHSACSVFEGRVVVSGGNNYHRLNTVEAYDHIGDTWENMPNMIIERSSHKSVAVKKKLFVIGGNITNECEVFDSTSNRFSWLKKPTSGFNLYDLSDVITIGSKILLFIENCNVIIYDFENNEWSVKTCEATRNLKYFSCVKVPV